MSANMIWTSENDEILIEFVKNHEVLYNVKSKDYRKAQLKQYLWSNIGTILETSGSDCCKRWAYVRDYYIRRRGKPGTGSSREAAKKRSDLLSFLDNFPSPQRILITNVVGGELPQYENELTDDTDIEENISQINKTENVTRINCNEGNNKDENNGRKDEVIRDNKKKKKLTHSEERLQLLKEIVQRKATPVQSELNEIDLFFNSIAKIVKTLPRYEQVQMRMQISSLVGNAELRSISSESRQTNDSSSRLSSTPNVDTTIFPKVMLSQSAIDTLNGKGQSYNVSDTSNESSSRPSSSFSDVSEIVLSPAANQKQTFFNI